MYWVRLFELIVLWSWISVAGVAGLAQVAIRDAGAPEATSNAKVRCDDAAACEAEVARVVQAIRMRPERLRAAPLVVRDLERTLQTLWPGCKPLIYGSLVTGLAFQWSDIDMTVQLPNATSPLGDLIMEADHTLMRRPGLFRVIKTFPYKRIPVLEVQHGPTGSLLDISLKNRDGIMNSKLIHHLLSLDDRLLDLALVVKYWAKLHGLTRKGYLPSYGIITMLIFFLQQKQILPSIASLQKNVDAHIVQNWNVGFREEKYPSTNDEPLCALLGGFFEYYANFDFDKFIITTYAGRPIEIGLFEDLSTVPEEFVVYKHNVASNITNPCQLLAPVVQDVFHHDINLARSFSLHPMSLFVNPFRDTAMKFKKYGTNFLESVLSDPKLCKTVKTNS